MASRPSRIGAIEPPWLACGFRVAHRFFTSGMSLAVSVQLCERVAPGNYVVVEGICVLNVTFFTDLHLSRIMCNLISYPSQML